METYRELTLNETAVLTAYAAKHGAKWKAKLMDDWSAGRTVGALQNIRNEFGPDWLRTFKLPDLS